MNLANMIEVQEGSIEKFVEQRGIDAVVNPARPSLMGGSDDESVDSAIHRIINEKEGERDYFKKYIIKKFKKKVHTKKEDVIRCNSGEAVITKGGRLCKYVIHTVGPRSDRNAGLPDGYSSSCVGKLVSCYENVMRLVFEYPEIETVAIPVISSGNYGFDFEYAFRIGLVTVYNELLKRKSQYREICEEIKLRKIYFVILSDNGNCERAWRIFDEYRNVFHKGHRVVYGKVLKSQQEALKEINIYDRQRGYFAIAKVVRQTLLLLRYFFSMWTLLKDVFGKWDWVVRRQVIEIVAFVKVIIPVLCGFLITGTKCSLLVRTAMVFILLYDLGDTVTYLIALMVLADVQRPSANVIRSLVMLVINYIEVQFDLAAIYLFGSNFIGGKAYGMERFVNFVINSSEIKDIVWLQFVNNGLKFFFLTVALSYFSNHMRMRKFRTI